MSAGRDDDLVVSRTCVIPTDELKWRFSGSGGPGGQHANTANTRVELSFDIASSRALGPRQKSVLLAKLGPTIRIVASSERSQLRNRDEAKARLCEMLRTALTVRRPRRPSAPTRGSKERRLQAKQARSLTKVQRRAPGPDD